MPSNRPPHDDTVAAQASIHDLVAWASSLELAEPPRGRAFAEQAIALARAADDRFALAAALEAAGRCCFHQAEYPLALVYLEEGTTVFAEFADLGGQARCLNWMGNAYAALADRTQAREVYERSLALHRAAGDRQGVIHLISNVATMYGMAGHEHEALAAYDEALPLARELGDAAQHHLLIANVALLRARLGRRLAERGDTSAARVSCEAALPLVSEVLPVFRRQGQRVREAQCLSAVAEAHHGLGDFASALAAHEAAAVLAEAAGDHRRFAVTLGRIGEVYLDQGQPSLAIPQFARAEEAVTKLGMRDEIVRARRALALAYERGGDTVQALAHFKRFHEAELEQQRIVAEGQAQVLLAQVRAEQARQEAESQRARAVELADAHQQLQDQASALLVQAIHLERDAHIDSLTGLANRRLLERTLVVHFAQSRATQGHLTVVLADIDHFKRINDTCSHLIGDEVLKAVGQILLRHCRAHDLAARYGGEEFALVLPACAGAAAYIICERLRQAVESYDWAQLHPKLRVTLSLGYSDNPAADTVSALLADADAYLYRAKQEGRNRVRPARARS